MNLRRSFRVSALRAALGFHARDFSRPPDSSAAEAVDLRSERRRLPVEQQQTARSSHRTRASRLGEPVKCSKPQTTNLCASARNRQECVSRRRKVVS